MPLGNKPFENTVGKGEIARNEQFLLFPQCFLPIWITFCNLRQIWNFCLQTLSVWRSPKFVVWQWVEEFLISLRYWTFTTQCWLLTTLGKRPFETLWKKEKMLVTSIFSFSHNVFYPSLNKYQFFCHIYYVVCKCFQFRQVSHFVIW